MEMEMPILSNLNGPLTCVICSYSFMLINDARSPAQHGEIMCNIMAT